jgi:hypothetical protein
LVICKHCSALYKGLSIQDFGICGGGVLEPIPRGYRGMTVSSWEVNTGDN